MDKDRRTEQKTWQVYNFGKRNAFRLDQNESRKGFCRTTTTTVTTATKTVARAYLPQVVVDLCLRLAQGVQQQQQEEQPQQQRQRQRQQPTCPTLSSISACAFCRTSNTNNSSNNNDNNDSCNSLPAPLCRRSPPAPFAGRLTPTVTTTTTTTTTTATAYLPHVDLRLRLLQDV